MSPKKNKPFQEIFGNKHGKNFKHIFKLHTRPNCNVKLVENIREEILDWSKNTLRCHNFGELEYFFKVLF
jgi:hypothetical protein